MPSMEERFAEARRLIGAQVRVYVEDLSEKDGKPLRLPLWVSDEEKDAVDAVVNGLADDPHGRGWPWLEVALLDDEGRDVLVLSHAVLVLEPKEDTPDPGETS